MATLLLVIVVATMHVLGLVVEHNSQQALMHTLTKLHLPSIPIQLVLLHPLIRIKRPLKMSI